MFEVKKHRGAVRLFKEGEAIPSTICYAGPKHYHDFKDAGIRIVTWNIPLGWVGDGIFDYGESDELIGEYLSTDPDISILPRITFPGNGRDWWCASHPGELVVLSNGEFGSGHSSASRIWLSEASDALSNFIRHVEKSNYAHNVLGYHICDGHFSEWFAWDSANFERDVHALRWVCEPNKGAFECPVPWPDYSEPMLEAFRNWLRKKYAGDADRLRKAWNRKELDFANIAIPTKQERISSNYFAIRDPSEQMNAIDYDLCFQDVHTDAMLGLCKTAKSSTEKLIGVFYGYTWTGFFRGFYMQNAGHLALHKVLRSPYVDFLASPCDYENRILGGATYSQSVPESVTLHGKLFFSEVDPKTHRTDPDLKWHHLEDFRPRTVEGTVELLKRSYAHSHAMGMGMWWMDLFNRGWYHDDEIIRALKRLREIDEGLLGRDQASNREIAVVLDERGLMYERACQNMAISLRSVQRQWEFAFIGAPFDTYLQSDLMDPSFKGEGYKLFIFVNNVFFTGDEVERIGHLIKKGGKVAIWEWAPGLISDEGLGIENMRQLTGINIDREGVEGHAHIDIVNYEHPITEGLPLGHCFGPEISRWHLALLKESGFIEDDPSYRVGPLFHSSDPEAIALGMLGSIGKVGFCVKRSHDWTSIFVATPYVSKDVLRNIAKFAGVHLYTDCGDLVYSNEHFLAICPRVDGKRAIRLPKPKGVTDLWTNERVVETTKGFEMDLKANRTYMYLLE